MGGSVLDSQARRWLFCVVVRVLQLGEVHMKERDLTSTYSFTVVSRSHHFDGILGLCFFSQLQIFFHQLFI